MKIFKLIGIMGLMCFSFYYVDKVANLGMYNSELYKTIVNNSVNYEIDYVNAEVYDEKYIVPGMYGKKINARKSYENMKSYESFSEYFLDFDLVKPDISLEENKDKIIKNGNVSKNAVSFIVNNNSIKNYFKSNNLKANILVDYNTFDSTSIFEQINNDLSNFKRLDNLMKKNDKNNSLCFISDENLDVCKKYRKYLISYTYLVDNNIIFLKNNVKSGNIYYVDDKSSLENLKLLIKEIKYKGLDIVYISELINEQID